MQDSSSGRTLPRAAQGGVGFALAALAFLSVVGRGEGLWHIVAFTLAPDLPLLIGGSREKGQISRWAVRPYNLTHRFVGPVVLGTISLGLGAAWLAGALAWAAHIALDRSLGFGLPAPDGSIRPEPAARPVVRALVSLAAVALVAGTVYETIAARGDPDRYPAAAGW